MLINENINVQQSFQFSKITPEEVLSEINYLDNKKVGSCKNIPTKILKETSEINSQHLDKIWNEQVIRSENLPYELKLADIIPIFKKEESTLAKNYRPVSALPCISKVFERITQKQLSEYIEKILTPLWFGYRKNFNTQRAIKVYAGTILMDLTKAFDTINHELPLVNLIAYDLDKISLQKWQSYLNNTWQINSSVSSWSALLKGVPQGSVLRPILFNIFLNDPFFILKNTDSCNFANDTTPHACNTYSGELLMHLEHDTTLTVCWFESNYMKFNTDKCHLLISGN